jgi:TonB family protein
MANQALIPLNDFGQDLRLMPELEQSLLSSLWSNLKDAFFPEKLPPLRLTSRPVKVRDIWGESSYKKRSLTSTIVLHVMVVGGLVALSLMGKKVVEQVRQTVTLVAPDISDYQPPLSPKPNDTIGGGGGGGDLEKIEAPKGKLPKMNMEQVTPPTVVVRNDHPKLAVEQSVVMPPQVKMAELNMPNIGVPQSKIAGPESNGTGSQAGIGSGSGGGIGAGTGGGVGLGSGGGTGGGPLRIGGGVSAPRAIYSPDPEYTEEARKAKYQGVVVLWLVIGPDGRPRDVRVARALGMGLDQKAVEAVRQWKFEPAMKDGKPVAVQLNVEVNFRLY